VTRGIVQRTEVIVAVVAIPEIVAKAATKQVEAFCETRIPAHVRDEIRLEYSLRGNAITIVERRPPWLPELGPDWSSMKIAQLRYDPDDRTWTLYCRDRNERWFLYYEVEPSRDVSPLLDEIDADPTGIFWG
jgi:Protein of unknown function (DUF3024)